MKNAKGVTVIELIVSLGISAILLALSFPALQVTRALLNERTEAAIREEPIWTARELIHSALISAASIKDLRTVAVLGQSELHSTYPTLGSKGSALHILIPEHGALLRRAERGRYRSIGWLDPTDIKHWIAISPNSVSRCQGAPGSYERDSYYLNCGEAVGLIGIREEVIFYSAKDGHLRRYSPLTGENQPLTSGPISLDYSLYSDSSKFSIGSLELIGEERSLSLPVAFQTASLGILELFS